MSAGPKVLLLRLSERTSAKGNAYLSGWLGKASVVGFRGEEPDKFGNPTWNLFVSTPEPKPKPEAGQQQRPETAARRAPARHQDGGDGWRGSRVPPASKRRPAGSGGRRRPVLRRPPRGHRPMTTDLPDPTDVEAWRALIHSAPDRPARQVVVRQWAGLLGCVPVDDADHVMQAPAGLPPAVAGALACHATLACLHLRAPSGGWPRSDSLPEWVPGR